MNALFPMERRLLQAALAIVSLIPLSAGLSGVVLGPRFFEVAASTSADSHMRYLSGLLLGIGFIVWWVIPRVEKPSEAFATLTAIVFVGGLSRLWSLIHVGQPNGVMSIAVFVELGLTPALYFWHRRVVRLSADQVAPLFRARQMPDPQRR
jgi:Domain of unknown function (DUF4345)